MKDPEVIKKHVAKDEKLWKRIPVTSCVATVQFGSVQTLILLNLELNLRFSSGKCLNWFRRFSSGSVVV